MALSLATTGVLHIYVAFDWGDEVHLATAQQLVPSEAHSLARRPRTPTSIDYQPHPLRLVLEPVTLKLAELGQVQVPTELTIFDFAAVSLAWDIPFSLPAEALTRLAPSLLDSSELVQVARQAIEPIWTRLQPAIDDPNWSELSEEYYVFQLGPAGPVDMLPSGPDAEWLAGLLRLETGKFSAAELSEALRWHLSYGPADLFVADWPAAVLIDQDCEETLEVIQFANLQLLQYRSIDARLDGNLKTAEQLIHSLSRSWLPFWRTHGRSLRMLGDLKVEANGLFERTGNVLKLVGDQYLARVHRVLAGRFHLDEWEQSIQRKLDVLQATYQTLSDQGATFRAELLEWLIIFLILVEIVLGLVKH